MAKLQVDESLVRKLSRLLEETGLTEIEYEAGDQRIRVVRDGTPGPPLAAPAQTPLPTVTDDRGDVVPVNAVTAPMVGTVYVAPEPDAEAFVNVGDTVEKGQTLVIIEAMKVMNQIPSPRAGRVVRILISDGQPVEYGEPLLVIE
jgi:acetyl-CoA carboxylase biotin carboxyl carrier protein